MQKYKETQTVVNQAYNEAEKNYTNKLGILLKENRKHFWKYVKTKRRKKSGISSILSDSGDIVHDAQGIANILNNQYKKVFGKDNDINIPTANRHVVQNWLGSLLAVKMPDCV